MLLMMRLYQLRVWRRAWILWLPRLPLLPLLPCPLHLHLFREGVQYSTGGSRHLAEVGPVNDVAGVGASQELTLDLHQRDLENK